MRHCITLCLQKARSGLQATLVYIPHSISSVVSIDHYHYLRHNPYFRIYRTYP